MKISLKKQCIDADININKEYPICWHSNSEGEKITDISISPVKAHIKTTFDIEIDTGDLSVKSVMKYMRAIQELDEKRRQKNCKVCKVE